ncbi:helix-turn-helix domain-containing protein [Candidatus Saccharibacteria bacterium]|nr:MAG: helix-turn-helix domain-containing protein [Candidatus Saccharibacteria bacterium]
MGDNKEFASLMRFLRERSGVSARQLSLSSGLSASYVSKIEDGAILPNIKSFANIISNLSVTPFEIAYLLQTFREDESEIFS